MLLLINHTTMTYDSIIFLNNAAVKLLVCNEQQCTRESIMTFRDAMYVKRFLYAQRANTSVTGPQQHARPYESHDDDFENVIVPTVLHNASRRLCNIQQRKTTMIEKFPLDEETLVTLNFMDDECFTNFLAYQSFLDQIDVAFRIDHETEEEYKFDERNWELNSAILLYNYALACKRTAQDSHHKRSIENNCKILQESMTFFQFAYDIVMVELDIFSLKIKQRSGHTKAELESILRIIMVAMFIAIQLSHFSYYYFNLSEQGDEYYEKYEKLSLLFNTIIKEYQSHPFALAKHAAVA